MVSRIQCVYQALQRDSFPLRAFGLLVYLNIYFFKGFPITTCVLSFRRKKLLNYIRCTHSTLEMVTSLVHYADSLVTVFCLKYPQE